MLNRYWLSFDIEMPAKDYPQAIERCLRLFRPRVRAGMRVVDKYQGSYRGSWFALRRLKDAPAEKTAMYVALDKAQRRKKLRRRKTKKGAKR